MRNIKIAITDDHALFRKSLSTLLSNYKDLEVVMEAENGPELLHKMKYEKVDVILLDIQMPDMNGIEVCNKLHKKFPHSKILMLTFGAAHSEISKAIDNGAAGFFTKNSSPEELVRAIRNIHHGEFYFEKSLIALMKEVMTGKKTSGRFYPQVEISSREAEIIKLYAEENNGKQIAEMLNISIRTVESHKKNLMEKTNSKNFIGVIIYALENDLISLNGLKS